MCTNEHSGEPGNPGGPLMRCVPSAAAAAASANLAFALAAGSPEFQRQQQYRLHQLYQCAVAERLLPRLPWLACYPTLMPSPAAARMVAVSDEPKPQHSYIGLIAMAILSAPDGKLVLSDIYQHILDHYPYFRTRGPGWRNSIRHNLSLNDCFVKAGRSANGKGHYWAIHPANVEDFRRGDFRRRKAQRKVRRHMGLAVDEDGADSPSPPLPLVEAPEPRGPGPSSLVQPPHLPAHHHHLPHGLPQTFNVVPPLTLTRRKRPFDVASLLAPDSAEQAAAWDVSFANPDAT